MFKKLRKRIKGEARYRRRKAKEKTFGSKTFGGATKNIELARKKKAASNTFLGLGIGAGSGTGGRPNTGLPNERTHQQAITEKVTANALNDEKTIDTGYGASTFTTAQSSGSMFGSFGGGDNRVKLFVLAVIAAVVGYFVVKK